MQLLFLFLSAIGGWVIGTILGAEAKAGHLSLASVLVIASFLSLLWGMWMGKISRRLRGLS